MSEPRAKAESDTVAATGVVPRPPPSEGALSSAAAIVAPKRLAGRYELLSLLGVGGMGAVYRAKDVELDEVVALKMLRRELGSDASLLARFRLEVKLARRVTHKNVARTYDIGEDDGQKFLTMELIDGESLAAVLARVGRMPLAKVVSLTEEICAGLSAAHAAGIVHRDLKPENVMLASDGRVVLTDFGIARMARELDGSFVKTMGVPIGTPAYMAPEQVEGSKEIDPRADLYALGAMIFELLTGERPWDGDSAYAVAAKRLVSPPPDPRDRVAELPEAVARLTMRCMARKPDDRFATAGEVAAALAGLTLPAATGLTAAPPPVRIAVATATPVGAKTVAVLPFRNGGPNEDEYLADGLTDDLIDNLSMTEGLKVRSRGVVMGLKGVDRDPRELGSSLGVQVVVEGSVRRAGERLRVNARVVSVSDGFQLWAKRFDCPAGEIFAVGDEMVRAVALALTVEQHAAAREGTADPAALDLYMRARHRYFQGWRGIHEAVGLFEQALERAPDHPTILAGYAMAQLRRFSFEETQEAAGERGRQAAEKALAVAPRMGEARVALAHWHLALAEPILAARELRQALKDAPGLADAHELTARMLLEAGAFEEGLTRARSAMALEPRLAAVDWMIPRAYLLRGELARAVASFPPVPESHGEPSVYWLNRARAAFWMRDVEFATEWFPKLRVQEHMAPGVLGMLGLMVKDKDIELGIPAVELSSSAPGRAVLRRQFFCQIRAEIFGFMGDTERSMRGLVDANKYELFDVAWLEGCPLIEALRQDPAYGPIRDAVAARARVVRQELGAAP